MFVIVKQDNHLLSRSTLFFKHLVEITKFNSNPFQLEHYVVAKLLLLLMLLSL